jgi:hypothetical protein
MICDLPTGIEIDCNPSPPLNPIVKDDCACAAIKAQEMSAATMQREM